MDQLLRVFLIVFFFMFLLLMPIFSVIRFVKDFKRTNKRLLFYGFSLMVICGYLILKWLNRHNPTPVSGWFFVIFELLFISLVYGLISFVVRFRELNKKILLVVCAIFMIIVCGVTIWANYRFIPRVQSMINVTPSSLGSGDPI